jgi:hypothetical protein
MCNHPVTQHEPAIEKQDLLGRWHEADTSTYAEGWIFTDTVVTHSFDGMDTMGFYPSWRIHNDSIILINQKSENEIILFKILDSNKVNLQYFLWSRYINKDFKRFFFR